MSIMLVDDDRECLDSLTAALRLAGFQVREFDCPVRALKEYNPHNIEVVITDYCLPGMNGIELLKKIHGINKEAPVIVISGALRGDTSTLCLDAGACAFFSKPLNLHRVITKIRQFVAASENG
jgi:DNA-binding NtrC family response regulator